MRLNHTLNDNHYQLLFRNFLSLLLFCVKYSCYQTISDKKLAEDSIALRSR